MTNTSSLRFLYIFGGSGLLWVGGQCTWNSHFPKGTIPILRQQIDWVGGVRWQFLLKFSTYYLCWCRVGGWVRKSQKLCWRNIGMISNFWVREQNKKQHITAPTQILYPSAVPKIILSIHSNIPAATFMVKSPLVSCNLHTNNLPLHSYRSICGISLY